VLTTISVAVFMVAVDVTVVVVALPQIQSQLALRLEDLQWVVNAYSLSFSAFLMVAGSLVDRFGRRLVFVCGIALFCLGSLFCGLATSGIQLHLARASQGIGAAMMSSAGLAQLASLFRGPDRAAAFGIWGTMLGLGIAFGPLIGGIVTASIGWHWVFLANIPFGLVFGGIAMAVIPESRDPHATQIDWGGFGTFTAALFLLVYALVAGNEQHWSLAILVMLAGAAGLLAVFIIVERRQARLMMANHVAIGECCGVTEHWLSNDVGVLRKSDGKALDEFRRRLLPGRSRHSFSLPSHKAWLVRPNRLNFSDAIIGWR
jgi:MFS family permease